MNTDYKALIAALTEYDVDFVIVGAVALVLDGSSRITRDLDICYARTSEHVTHVAEALAPLKPTLRGAPDGLPFTLDAAALKSGLNFALPCAAGDIDLLGEITSIGGYAVAHECLRRCEGAYEGGSTSITGSTRQQ